ncbi:killer cell lectin-like receptor subfamily B member 1B allele B [Heteronotia binoei]|uniref:killer cell lectin-like receptor subfamily B member 1B allele B n=1 Tax=Heteronotia binoei TaxID=13085 RepID=UPI00292E4FFA|nr:killer cell lectin-like receptor subfamily B member 1B allele B [Heteronotia binoei]
MSLPLQQDFPVLEEDALQNPRWHQILLWVVCFGIVILVAVVIILLLQLEAEKKKAGAGCYPVKSNCSSDNFQSLLRSRICNQSEANSPCQICSPHWHLHQDRCYWLSTDIKSWNESRSDCTEKGAQLVVIPDKEEMEILKKIMVVTQTYWIGLYLSEKKWRWITDHQLDQNLFQEPPSSAGNESCGRIKDSKIIPDVCNAVFRWICQKDPIVL